MTNEDQKKKRIREGRCCYEFKAHPDAEPQYICDEPIESWPTLCLAHREKRMKRELKQFLEIVHDRMERTGKKQNDFRGFCFPKNFEDFKRVTFHDNVNFSDSYFEGNADFMAVKFMSNADFRSVTFTCNADFQSTNFNRDANFEGVKFTRDVNFRNAMFMRKAYFFDAMFTDNADFHDATFTNTANFHDVTFTKDADFNNAIFMANVDFQRAEFMCDACFWDTSITGSADFSGAKIEGNLDFSGAMIEGNSAFISMTISGDADFVGTTIKGRANFVASKIRGDADFLGAQIEGDADFQNVGFDKSADFRVECFGGDVDFYGATLPPSGRFGRTKEWRKRSKIKSGKGMSLFRFAKQVLQNMGLYREAGDFHFEERRHALYRRVFLMGKTRTRRVLNLLNPVIFIPALIEFVFGRIIFGYGERPNRIVAAAALVVGCCAWIYDYSEAIVNKSDEILTGVEHAVYFSIVTFTTLGFGDYTPVPGHPIWRVAAFEAVAGAFLMAAFIVTLARRWGRG